MVKIIKKTFNFQSLFGRNGFGKTNFGTNSPKFYNASADNTPEIVYVIDISTPAQIIHKDLPSIDIEYTTLNIENFNVYYKINSCEYNFVENINYNDSPYTLDLSSIVLNDNDLITIKFENDLTSDNVTFTCEHPYITITSSGGDVDVDSIINMTYDWNDVDLIDVYYQINGDSEILYEENVVPSGTYNFDTEPIEFSHGDTLTVIFKDSDDSSVSDNENYTIIVSEIIINSINNSVPIEFNEGPYTEDTNYWYGDNGEIVEGTDVDVTPLFYGVGNANGFIDLDIREMTISMDTPSLSAGTEGNITGTHSGGSADWYVDVYYRILSPEGSWQIFEEGVVCDGSGNWTATGTILTADTYDFKAVDSVNSSAYDQVDDVVVESG